MFKTHMHKALDALRLQAQANKYDPKKCQLYTDKNKLKIAKEEMAKYQPFTNYAFQILLMQTDTEETVLTATYDFIDKNLHKIFPMKHGWKMPKPPAKGYMATVEFYSMKKQKLAWYKGNSLEHRKFTEPVIDWPWIAGSKINIYMWEALGFNIVFVPREVTFLNSIQGVS